MTKIIFPYFIILLMFICRFPSSKSKIFIEDYCWRDFAGIIPSDAIAAGLDGNGNPVFIGQVLHENKLIPGQIYKNNKNIYFEMNNREISTNENVKILCSKNAHRFEFIQSRANEVVLFTNKLLVKGGYEPNYSTYIGRVETGGVTNIGKIICSINDCLGLYVTNNGAVTLHTTFQILTYNPNIDGDVVP